MTNFIEIKRLTTGYSKRGAKANVISSDINATMNEGELICLLGPNGAGKSTLLKTITGYLSPLSGDILVNGKSICNYTIQERARLISLVTTERIHFPDMTVYDLVAMGRSPYTGFWGKLSDNDKLIVNKSLDMVGMLKFQSRRADTLSDGERQKVLIAKAIAQQTPAIILDEPTAFLDYPSKVQMMIMLRRLAHNLSKLIFISTHDLRQALLLADRLWLIDHEKGFTTGTADELSENGKIASYFNCSEMVYDPKEKLFNIIDKNSE